MAALAAARELARSVSLTPSEAARHGLALNKDGQRRTAFELLSYPDIGIAQLARIWPRFAELPPKIAEQLEIDAKYDVYLSRQAADIAAYRRDESLELPDDLDYAAASRACPTRSRQKLQSMRPRTIGQAGRIDGMTPAALTLLVAHHAPRGGTRGSGRGRSRRRSRHDHRAIREPTSRTVSRPAARREPIVLAPPIATARARAHSCFT